FARMTSTRRIQLFALLSFLCFQPLVNSIAFEVFPGFRWISTAISLLSLLLLLLFAAKKEPPPLNDFESELPIRVEWFLIGLLITTGLFLRTWRLGSLFEGMGWDEAYKGLDGIAIHQFHERPVYLNWNAGREAMIAYLVAFSQNFLDHTIASVRIVLALAG